MLIEEFVLNGITVLSANTDGVVIRYKKSDQPLIDRIHKWWENTTQLILEDTFYDKIVQSNVSSYLAVLSHSGPKFKGEYEIDKALHKDHSALIVPKALAEYHIHGTPVETTIRNCKDIYDFCLSSRMKSNQAAIMVKEVDRNIIEIPLGKTNRYYVSNKGVKLIKKYDKGTRQELVANRRLTLFNKYEELDNYNIDYSYYIQECNKRIRAVSNSQLSLF